MFGDYEATRRRIYDSINVMIALGVLSKQNKIIKRGNSHADERRLH
jgi:hypothetical protein